jgi:NifU-like protein involved in Fe-S cluster formation
VHYGAVIYFSFQEGYTVDFTATGQPGLAEKVIALAQQPLNMGQIPDAHGIGLEGSECGDWVRMWIKLDGADRISDAKFQAYGCASALASSSVLTELAKGKTVSEALEITSDDVITALGGLPEHKMHCSQLSYAAYRKALQACVAQQY